MQDAFNWHLKGVKIKQAHLEWNWNILLCKIKISNFKSFCVSRIEFELDFVTLTAATKTYASRHFFDYNWKTLEI